MTITIQDVLFDAGTTQEIEILGKALGDVLIEEIIAILRTSPPDQSLIEITLHIPQIDIPDEDE